MRWKVSLFASALFWLYDHDFALWLSAGGMRVTFLDHLVMNGRQREVLPSTYTILEIYRRSYQETWYFT